MSKTPSKAAARNSAAEKQLSAAPRNSGAEKQLSAAPRNSGTEKQLSAAPRNSATDKQIAKNLPKDNKEKEKDKDKDKDKEKENKEKQKDESANEVSTKIYARVRGLMPWEPKKVSLSVVGNKVQNRVGHIVNEYDFGRVFKPTVSNEDVFKVIVVPMISNVLEGYNAVLIAYGQTGSGKTFSMLGKPKLGVIGLLPRMLEYFVQQKSVTTVELSAVEAFGHHVAKIELFDLYDPDNQTQVWNDKKGSGGLDMDQARTVKITDAQDAHDKIIYAHAASHFAPTGKNPESSRGHVTFVAKITQQKAKHESQISYFVMVDCAGSEGESAFTDDFKARVDQQTLIARRLEAGTINTGLSQLQVVFNQLRIKGELTKTIGNGLRRVLHPYINTRTYLAVLFTLSPSVNNAKPTESTLKFAVTAGMVKVKPVASKGNVDFENLVAELKSHIASQEKVIEENNETIDDITRQITRTQNCIDKAQAEKNENKDKKDKNNKNNNKKNNNNNNNNDDDGDEYDDEELKTPHFAAAKLDEDVSDALLTMLDSSIQDLEDEINNTKPPLGRHRTVTLEENNEEMKQAMDVWTKQTQPVAKKPAQNNNLKKPQAPLQKRVSKIQVIQEQAVKQENDYIRLKDLKVDKMTKEDLTGHAMELQVLLQEQKALVEGLSQSKKIIMDYLKEDGREALLQWFKLRKLV